MGWVASPNYLCAVTETIADLTLTRFLSQDFTTTPHHLDSIADTLPTHTPPAPPPPATPLPQTVLPPSVPPLPLRSRGPLQRPLTTVDVFMDDFILATQLPRTHRSAVRRTLFSSIDRVLRPLSPSDNPARKEPNSTKKLLQGDASWSTQKLILGWLIDTVARTVALPPHRVDRLHLLLQSFPCHQRRTSRRKWQCLIGELRSMALAIPGGAGLFSQLQSVLTYATHPSPTDRLSLSPAVHHQLSDLRSLAADLTIRPTRWGEIVDSDPSFLGAVDACGTGMGGIWLDATGVLPPLLWRHPFPSTVAATLTSFANPTGTLTNSDFEQLGVVCHSDVLANTYDVRERTIATLSDNTAAVSRSVCGSSSVDAASAYLCRLAALHQRFFRYRQQVSYVPGPLNVMADTLSRRWDLSDASILSLFNSLYPQALQWTSCPLRSAMASSAISALLKQPCDTVLLQAVPPWLPLTPPSGPPSVNNITWTPTSPLHPIQSRGYKSSLATFAMAGFPPLTNLSDLAQWRMRSTSSRRRSPSWVRPTHALPHTPHILTSV